GLLASGARVQWHCTCSANPSGHQCKHAGIRGDPLRGTMTRHQRASETGEPTRVVDAPRRAHRPVQEAEADEEGERTGVGGREVPMYSRSCGTKSRVMPRNVTTPRARVMPMAENVRHARPNPAGLHNRARAPAASERTPLGPRSSLRDRIMPTAKTINSAMVAR